ncbi:MAG: cytochrome C oxidase subunit IV family protein [Dehalococcoidia bacterium]
MTLADYRRDRGEPVVAAEEAHAEHHPGPMEYIQIGAILTFITAVEVGIYYIDMSHTLLVLILMVLSVTKFSMVVLWFMHLKFDNRLFSVFFVGGMALTLVVFAVAIAALRGQLV